MLQSLPDVKIAPDLFTLRVGDVVLFEVTSMDPLIRAIAKIKPDYSYDEDTKRVQPSPLIGFELVPGETAENVIIQNGLRYINGAWIRHRFSQGPAVAVSPFAKNALVPRKRFRDETPFYERVGDTVECHPYQLAVWILQQHHQLDIRYGLDSKRFFAEWRRAGEPGAATPYGEDHYGERWMRLKAFRRWVLRRWPIFAKTWTVYAAERKQHAKNEWNSYIKDLEYEERRDRLGDVIDSDNELMGNFDSELYTYDE